MKRPPFIGWVLILGFALIPGTYSALPGAFLNWMIFLPVLVVFGALYWRFGLFINLIVSVSGPRFELQHLADTLFEPGNIEISRDGDLLIGRFRGHTVSVLKLFGGRGSPPMLWLFIPHYFRRDIRFRAGKAKNKNKEVTLDPIWSGFYSLKDFKELRVVTNPKLWHFQTWTTPSHFLFKKGILVGLEDWNASEQEVERALTYMLGAIDAESNRP